MAPHVLYKPKAQPVLPSFNTPSSLVGPLGMATERDPLLSASSTSLSGCTHQSRSPVGPLEISQSTRYAILAGLWSATFLSVCAFLSWNLDVLISPPSFVSL